MATPRKPLTALAAAALALALVSCSSDGPGNSPGHGQEAEALRPDGSEPVPPTAPEEEPDREPPPSAAPSPAEEPAPDADRGSETVVLHGARLEVVVQELVRSGETAELTLVLSNSGQSNSPTMEEMFGGTEEGRADLSSVELVDSVSGKVHKVARDEQGACVCSRLDPHLSLWPGDRIRVSATFRAPSEDVARVDVRVPFAGTFSGVPVA
ncbi:hypothetical protein ACOALZ_03230 [Nocardiopsis algeriensis]|uniref:hypothetical protein n=1 Tax=Nocardiopsis algeriensis TaxID=1478215 RepID=UPI003B43392F